MFFFYFQDLVTVVRVNATSLKLLFKQANLVITQFYGYLAVLMSFLIFLKWNGSIVVGDKSAHEASIHLPQVSVILVRLQKKIIL
jgi:hypothetical protein